MYRHFPLEIHEAIIRHVDGDTQTLQNTSLVCRDFRAIAQSLLFSSVMFDGREPASKLFEDITSGQIAGHIKNLNLMYYCIDWFKDEHSDGWKSIESIIKKAKNLRSLKMGPFYIPPYGSVSEFYAIHLSHPLESIISWEDFPDDVVALLRDVLPRMEEVALEDIIVPADVIVQLKNAKVLHVHGTTLYDKSRTKPKPAPLPAPMALAVSTGFHTRRDLERNLVNFSQLTTLRMEVTSDDEFQYCNMILNACHQGLECLRLYVQNVPFDVDNIDLSGLTKLRTLYVVVHNLPDPVELMAEIVTTLNSEQTSLQELFLCIVDDEEYWTPDAITSGAYDDSWEPLDVKLKDILAPDGRVTLRLPPNRHNIPRARVEEYVRTVFPSVNALSAFTLDGIEIEKRYKHLFTFYDGTTLKRIWKEIERLCVLEKPGMEEWYALQGEDETNPGSQALV